MKKTIRNRILTYAVALAMCLETPLLPTSVNAESYSGKKKDEKAPQTAQPADETDAGSEGGFNKTAAVNSDLSVTVTADKDVLPEDGTLTVKKLGRKDDETEKVNSAVDEVRPDTVSVAEAYVLDISVLDGNGKEIEPDTSKGSVKVSFETKTVENENLDCSVYHVTENTDQDETKYEAEKLDTDKRLDTVSAETDGFSAYVVEFTYKDMSYTLDGDNSVPLTDILSAAGLKGNVEAAKSSDPKKFSVEKTDNGWMVKAEKAFTSEESLTVTIDGIAYKITVTDDQNTGIYIRALSTQLFYGASRVSENNYCWTPSTDYNSSEYMSGHRISYRINFAISGVDKATAEQVKFRIPKSILKDRSGNKADSIEMSIPSKDDITAATNADGTIDSEQIDNDIDYAWYEDGDDIVIYNFREVAAGDNGYIELSYITSEDSFAYVDTAAQTPFICTMTIGDGSGENQTKTADPINLSFDTTALITSTSKRYPYGNRIKTWDDSWGDAVKPADPNKYYYLVWTIVSNVKATQPYTFSINDTLTSNHGGMIVLGYKFSGQSTYGSSNQIENQTERGDHGKRYDYVLTAIPLDTYESQNEWEAYNTETATVTPVDRVDAATSKKASQTWSWSKPVFHEPTGHFIDFKIGDGAYRANQMNYVIHYASTMDFRAGEYSRYDLESFNGYDGADKTLSEYSGFDYAAWVKGYAYPWTVDGDASDPANYGKKNVKYVLTDDGVFLLNNDSALLSSDGSSARTIDNKKIDSTKAIKLTSSDFRINKLEYSWCMRDADFDDVETGEYITKDPTYTDSDVLTFYGKFDDSDDWIQIGTYNIKTGEAVPVSEYVSEMTGSVITLSDSHSMTAYKVETENAHYYSEIMTVPFMTLKNTDAVQNLLKDKTDMLLVNNSHGEAYAQSTDGSWYSVYSGYHSDTDYACVSKRESSLKKTVISTSNNTKRKYYLITWKLNEQETGTTSLISQNGGTFYDLLPAGAVFVKKSVEVVSSSNGTLSDSDYTVTAIDNYENTGRTMVRIDIKAEAPSYSVTFDTRHSWDSISDYGVNVYNPCAYETGNDSITNGYADNGGTVKADGTKVTSPVLKEADLMKDLSKNTGKTEASETGKKFIYADNRWDINALTSSSAGLMKKVKEEGDPAYSYDTTTQINGNYSYELRFKNSFTSAAKDLVLIDSLENYDRSTMRDNGTDSDWRGALQSIDTAQMTKAGAAPVVYVSTKENLNPETDNNVADTSVWAKADENTDLSAVKAVAIDIRKGTDGKDFVLSAGSSVTAHLFMKAPASAPDPDSGEKYPYAYNNIYISDTVLNNDSATEGSHFLIHQDYTRIGLKITGSFILHKTASNTGASISGITYRLFGTSAYGTNVDITRKTDAKGLINFKDIEKGSYMVQETDATDDYLLDSTQYPVTIDSTGAVTIEKAAAGSNGVNAEVVDLPRVHTDISFMKINSIFTTTMVSGAEYSLTGKSDYGTDVYETAVSEAKGKNGQNNVNTGKVTFKDIEKGTYKLKEIKAPDGYALDANTYTVTVDETGGFTITSDTLRQKPTGRVVTSEITKYSHTQNINDDGTQNSNYGNSWANANITGTDRGDTSKAHVVTIDGASKVHVKIVYGGESASWDWACMWAGSHPDYTAYNNYSSSLTGKLGGGSHTSTSNTKEYDVDGDSVTFAFKSDGSGYGDGYGYYAVITGTGSVPVMEDTYEVETDSKGRYTLKNEPLHTVTFTKKSAYDKSVVAGAKFRLHGVSDSGNAVDQAAVSGDETGTTKFTDLESGTYALEETEAPEEYEKDESKYIVDLKSDGTYTISSLNKTDDVYDFYDPKKPDKQVTVTKIWDDGRTNHIPDDLAVTINTDVPEASVRTYKIKYDANGGSFGSATVNTLSYNAKNEVTAGTYAEPAPADSDNYYFLGWSTSKTGTSADFTPTPNDTTNSKLNGVKAGETKTVYAVYKPRPYVYYAVSPYGIGKETLKEGTAGITFGPATGNMFSSYTNGSNVSNKYTPMVNAHAVNSSTYLINDSCVSDGTATADEKIGTTEAGSALPKGQATVTASQVKADMDAVQPEGEATITDSSKNAIVGADAGTDASGNAYRCIHYDNWNTILYWNEHDPHVYDKCITNHCSKRLIIRPTFENDSDSSSSGRYWKWNAKTSVPSGDGNTYAAKSKWDIYWDSNYTDIDEYSASLIRARLVGADQYTSEDSKSAGEGAKTKLTESGSVYASLPSAIRSQIGAKALYDTSDGSKHGTNISGSSGPYYDKVWLFDYNEIFNRSNSASSSVYTERNAYNYGARGSETGWWLRSRYDNSYACRVNGNGDSNHSNVSNDNRVAFGFVLRR